MVRLRVKTFNVGDVEDPDLYLSASSYQWLDTSHGVWCKQHAFDLIYKKFIDYNTFSNVYYIEATFTDEDALIYKLKWGDT